jgi:hypothetical protein
MTQEELMTEITPVLARTAELSEAVHIAMQAEEHTAEDLAAIMTAADIVKTLADDLAAKVGPSHSKSHRKAVPVVDALRLYSMGCRLLYDGLIDKSAALLQMGAAQFRTASQNLVSAVRAAAQ